MSSRSISGERDPLGLLQRALIPVMRVPSQVPRTLPPDAIPRGIRYSAYEFWADTNFSVYI